MRKVLLSALMVGVVTTGAMAGTASDDFTVTATVDPYCEVTTPANDLTIPYNPFNTADATATTSTEFNCVNGTSYTINVVYDGTLEGATDPTQTLSFTATPDITSGTDTDGLASTNSVSIAIVIPAGQDVPVDSYSDSVTVEINY
ncbi:spore coat protein U domain-containing protein [Persephonella sp.]